MTDDVLDCLIIGGGPAGLTAAIYLARFHLGILVVDRGGGRARMIPCTHNHAGFPGGIAGNDLVDRMAEQARQFGARIEDGEVARLETGAGDDGIWRIALGDGTELRARAVLLATGVTNSRPAMADGLHDEALARGLLRYCPVCDGFEVTDRRLAVIGTGEHGASEAQFVRGFTRDVTLIAERGAHDLSSKSRDDLAATGITLIDGPVTGYSIDGDRLAISLPDGRQTFQSIYPALGSVIHSQLAIAAGAKGTEEGCLVVDSHQRTSVRRLYAAGDVVIGLDQISSAMGQAGVAATAIRNDLAEEKSIMR